MKDSDTPKIYTIPPDVAFMPALVKAIVEGGFPKADHALSDPAGLMDWTIYVPTRRAARALITAFLKSGTQQAQILPAIKPLGDIEIEELPLDDGLLGFETAADEPPIPTLSRVFIFANLIESWAEKHPENELAKAVQSSRLNALDAAQSLARLIDRFENDNVPLTELVQLAQDNLAMHHRDALAFLSIVTDAYPEILRSRGEASIIDHRSRRLRRNADLWRQQPPPGPVIAAGSTGTIRATAELLGVIARLENGAVVLPGLDLEMDEPSWQSLDQRHPQYGLRSLLDQIGCDRQMVKPLPLIERCESGKARTWLLSEVMRPSGTTHKWREVLSTSADRIGSAVENLNIIAARDQGQEAAAIALIMRAALEEPDKTCALITPDRNLARQVKAELLRWDLKVDDSAGDPLSRSPPGNMLLLLIKALLPQATNSDLMALLNHRFCTAGFKRPDLLGQARLLELHVLRRGWPFSGLDQLPGRVAHFAAIAGPVRNRGAGTAYWSELADLAERLSELTGPLQQALTQVLPFPQLLRLHIETLEAMTHGLDGPPSPLWQGEDGEALSDLLNTLLQSGENCPGLTGPDYFTFLESQLAQKPVRPTYAYHPRLAIYGLLEARLMTPDITILGGLNEDSWPPAPESDPWLNRTQKRQLDLQLPEQRVGLSAHDFVQAASGKMVWITHAKKINSSPVLESRWLQRLGALLSAVGKQAKTVSTTQDWLAWTGALTQPDAFDPVKPAAPTPPLALRPVDFSVTQVDTLLKDPYSIFAAKILGLNEIEPLDAGFSARNRGIAVHNALQIFVAENDDMQGALSSDELHQEISHAIMNQPGGEEYLLEWRGRLRRLADWFIAHERQGRADTTRQWTEVTGKLEFATARNRYSLKATADRIDLLGDQTLRLIDYKTGSGDLSFNPTSETFSAQLLLEAVIARAGGFKGVEGLPVTEVAFLTLTGGEPAGKRRAAKPAKNASIDDLAQTALDHFKDTLNAYEDAAQAYLPLGWTRAPNRELPFDHLNRWREWGHVTQSGTAQHE